MIITKISIQKDISRCNIYIDGDFAFGIDYSIKQEYDLYKGKSLDEETIQLLKDKDDIKKAKNRAYNYLSYRQRTCAEMKKYLESKDFNNQTVENTISTLLVEGYLDDYKFAETFLLEKSSLKGYGPYRIKHELRNKGINDNIIESILDIYEEDIEELTRLVLSKYKNILNEERDIIYRKVGGFLQRRGHSYDTIKKVLNKIFYGDD
ncbi:MAG: RecX family transcriptional regulator [Gudongella sp.]|nr:RecX family transcriptional regulator [Gudongella sp.]